MCSAECKYAIICINIYANVPKRADGEYLNYPVRRKTNMCCSARCVSIPLRKYAAVSGSGRGC